MTTTSPMTEPHRPLARPGAGQPGGTKDRRQRARGVPGISRLGQRSGPVRPGVHRHHPRPASREGKPRRPGSTRCCGSLTGGASPPPPSRSRCAWTPGAAAAGPPRWLGARAGAADPGRPGGDHHRLACRAVAHRDRGPAGQGGFDGVGGGGRPTAAAADTGPGGRISVPASGPGPRRRSWPARG
jgi:hypothetical protein